MRRNPTLGLCVLAGALVGCETVQSALPNSEPLPTPYVIPTLDAAEVAGLPELPDSIDLDAGNQYGEPSGVSSYSILLDYNTTLTAEDGTQSSGRIAGAGTVQADPPATSITFSSEGITAFPQGDEMTLTQIGGADYVELPDGECLGYRSGESPTPYTAFFGATGIVGALEGAQLGEPPTQFVNGVRTVHYTFDETTLVGNVPAAGGFEQAQGDLYIAVDGGYVVRLTMTGHGPSTLPDGTTGDEEISYRLEYSDFDKPINLAPPTECESLAERG